LNSNIQSDSQFNLAHRGDLRRLRDALVAGGYNEACLGELFGLGFLEKSVLLKATSNGSRAHTLVRLFKLAEKVQAEAARTALEPLELDQLAGLGLLRQVNGHVEALAAISPESGDLYVAHDFDPVFARVPTASNYVLEAGPSSHALGSITVRRGGERMLDLCTGGGIQSLLAAQHARHIVGTDLSLRALNFAEFNARLNGIANLELRCGNLFEPVADERFDLIVANPPFVISPQARYLYRDGGLAGDAICERVIRGVAAHLEEGGFSSTLFNWHHRDDRDWMERPLSWTANNGCDVWLAGFESETPLTYTARWLRGGEGRHCSDWTPLLEQWLEYHRGLGAEKITIGALIMRRRSAASNWSRADRLANSACRESFSEQILRIFAAQDFLQEVAGDEQLMDHAFALGPDHELRQVAKANGNGWEVQSASLRHTRGFEFIGRLDAEVMTILGECDGKRTLREIFTALAARLNADFGRLAPVGCDVIRSLFKSGFMTIPADSRFAPQPPQQ